MLPESGPDSSDIPSDPDVTENSLEQEPEEQGPVEQEVPDAVVGTEVPSDLL